MWLNGLTFLVILDVIKSSQSSEGIKVTVEQGVLEGEQLEVSTGCGTYFSFKGIPYAEPPVGRLRFQAPQPPLKWNGVRCAKEHGSQCIQRSFFGNDVTFGAEDCLFLNVYSPDLNPKNLMAVIVFFHGGGYVTGSGDSNIFGPDFLMQFGVVLVTINYRLGPLGFLNLNTKEVPGNAALKDQVAAMKWVKKNIAQFGGDPDCVTLMGQSIGAAAVSMHIVSPLSKGLFKRAVMMSGSLLHDYAFAYETYKRAFALGKQLGIDTRNVTELYEFLLTAPLKEMFSVEPIILLGDSELALFHTISYFGPVVEKDSGGEHFFTEDPEKLLRSGKVNHVDIMAGHTNYEALYIDAILEKDILKYYPTFHSFLVSVKIKRIVNPFKDLDISDSVLDYYYGNKTISEDTMIETIRFDTDNHYTYDMYRLLNAYPDKVSFLDALSGIKDTKKYSYTFSYYDADRNLNSKPGSKYNLKGAAHSDDLWYYFDRKTDGLSPVNNSSDTYKIIQRQCTLLTNFAKHGNPTPDKSLGAIWKPYTVNSKNEIIMGDQLEATVITYDGTYLGFWKKILNENGLQF